jgi:hypothetical protein
MDWPDLILDILNAWNYVKQRQDKKYRGRPSYTGRPDRIQRDDASIIPSRTPLEIMRVHKLATADIQMAGA